MAKGPIDAAKVIEGALENLGQLPAATLLEIGHFATTMIIARTKRGLDADLKPFKAYKPAYVQTRARRGLGSTPDLAVTGHMFQALGPVVTGHDELTLRFLSRREAQKAEWQNYGTKRGIPPREFADIRADKETQAIADLFGEAIAANLEKSIK